jgi:thymidylate synthase
MNKYFTLLKSILKNGELQKNKKGDIKFLINQAISFNEQELISLFSEYKVAKQKLEIELDLYMQGEDDIAKYKDQGIHWWDYCLPKFVGSYPQYFKKLPKLIDKINLEKRNSKNYVLFIGDSEVETNQLPCLSLIQFQIANNKLDVTIYQRSADSNLGLPSDIYQMYVLSKKIDLPLNSITFFIGNAHVYSNNIESTKNVINNQPYKFNLNT